MLYTTFIRLCDEAANHNDPEEFIMNLGWQEWMNKTSDADEITKDLSLIFELAGLDFRGLRKRLDVSMAKMSTMYWIPLRTIENWNSGKREMKDYDLNFIRYTIYVSEKEGDDGYIGYLTEQD